MTAANWLTKKLSSVICEGEGCSSRSEHRTDVIDPTSTSSTIRKSYSLGTQNYKLTHFDGGGVRVVRDPELCRSLVFTTTTHCSNAELLQQPCPNDIQLLWERVSAYLWGTWEVVQLRIHMGKMETLQSTDCHCYVKLYAPNSSPPPWAPNNWEAGKELPDYGYRERCYLQWYIKQEEEKLQHQKPKHPAQTRGRMQRRNTKSVPSGSDGFSQSNLFALLGQDDGQEDSPSSKRRGTN